MRLLICVNHLLASYTVDCRTTMWADQYEYHVLNTRLYANTPNILSMWYNKHLLYVTGIMLALYRASTLTFTLMKKI